MLHLYLMIAKTSKRFFFIERVTEIASVLLSLEFYTQKENASHETRAPCTLCESDYFSFGKESEKRRMFTTQSPAVT